MLERLESYEAVRSRFRWAIPEYFNIGVDICDKWATDPARLALIHERRDGSAVRYTFADMLRMSNQAASVFVAMLGPHCTSDTASTLNSSAQRALFTLRKLDSDSVLRYFTNWKLLRYP